jgi:Cytochrome c554 and c-prime/Doubled CXXCH motif (Paired_CXXCH_1)
MRSHRHIPVASALACLTLSWACTSESIAYRDRETFNPPPDSVVGFLGYFEPSQQLTTCGNCHVGRQAEWAATAHSHAYQTLLDSDGAQDSCFGCHTVNQRGNAVTVPAGWDVIQSEAYHDVQCENCHGPGLDHVQAPGVSAPPLPSLAVPVPISDATNGCAECHQGNHHPFANEWAQSKHAEVVTFAAAREECAACHRGQATLTTWGVRADYAERDAAEPLPVTCGVCHDPHDVTYEGQLRFPVETTSFEEHLCSRCHNRGANPDPASSRGLAPHSPETGLLQGTAGWFAPNFGAAPGQIVTSHGAEGNPDLCATCHVTSYTVTDQETGAFVFNVTGHLFSAIPCVDSQEIPQAGDCAVTEAARSFVGCIASGCHDSEADAVSALNVSTAEIQLRAGQLLSQLTQVDPGLDAPGGIIDPTVPSLNVAEG